ncbi:enterochelin esterase [Comamonas antarctica]|uniref:Enterochelin esterase n=1 Tax=Comamonas antarctica TaxID=2743470 RepID=A0A6N1XC19_9BURK|nr:enterochelin esterase [Comamonas antarctica]QKV55340.1 enterochelin esterase [Comamonas antarctica]
MTNISWSAHGAAAAVLALTCQWVGAAEAAAAAPAWPAVQGEVQMQPRALALELPARHVVQIQFEGAGVNLDLRDAQGRHLRRLAENGRGVQTATWYSQGAQQEQLWVTPAAPSATSQSYALKLLGGWPSDGPQPLPAAPAQMGPRLQALQQALARGEGEAASAAFWREAQQRGTPWVEPWSDGKLLVTFVWRDQGNTNVRLFGNPSGNHDPLQRLAGSDVWWTSAVLDPRTRLSYAFAPDVPQLPAAQAAQQRRMILATMQRDPLNRQPFPASSWSGAQDRFQGRSSLVLSKAPPQPWVKARAGVAQGTLTRHSIDSAILGNHRDVWTYVPAGADPQALLVLFDAQSYVHDVPTPRILDNLVADGLLPPMAALIVGNASPEARGTELPPNPQFARFMAEELMPWAKRQGLAQTARRTVVAGSSYGGLVSSYLGLTHPELFGNVLSLSGSYWWAPAEGKPGWMQRAWQGLPAPVPAVRFYLDAGWFESGRGGREGILETNRELADILRARGLAVTQRENASGHDYLHWQGALGCGLVALLAPARYDMRDPALQGCVGAGTP